MDKIDRIKQLNETQAFIQTHYPESNAKNNILINIAEIIDFLDDEESLNDIYPD